MKKVVTCFFFLTLLNCLTLAVSQSLHIYGYILDKKKKPVEFVNVAIAGTTKGTATDAKGFFELYSPSTKDSIVIKFSCLGFSDEEKVISFGKETEIRLDVILKETSIDLEDYVVKEYRKQASSTEVLDVSKLKSIPDIGGGIEALISTQAGVSSNNELSSQYSVRGGNFDENSVYVNNIEVYRPLLVRAGQQEGLSFVNPDMVESVEFSSGGFSAQYGDKMSSVLDIHYKKPIRFEGSASVSLLGASAYIGTSNSRFTQLHGVRYKTSSYLLGSLETEGEYDPNFFDYQTYLTYTFSKKWEISFLGNFSQNDFRFEPQTRNTSFGTMTDMKEFTVYFEGKEKDIFRTLFGALTLNFKPKENVQLGWMVSSFNTSENETYDISGEYWLSELDGSNNMSVDKGDGLGKYHEHARNKLNATVINISQLGEIKLPANDLKWGLSYQREIIEDKINEWELRDSAGFSLPSNPDKLVLYYNLSSDQELLTNRFIAYIQDTYIKRLEKGKLVLTGGVRANYWNFNKELLLSPRASVAWFPEWERNFGFRLATGIYYQSPFYKEIRDTVTTQDGNTEVHLNDKLKAQRSFQILLGGDYYFRMWERPFKFTTEIYYKYIDRIIPYSVDNVRVLYSGKNNGDGYAAGVDMKLFGEFVPGTDSWISFSLMKTEENIYGDGRGYIPRPTDQRYNISLFFQDYFPGFSKLKVNLKLVWADGLPFGPPRSERYMAVFRTPDYRRVDLGASYGLTTGRDKIMEKKLFKWMRSLTFNLDVFNLLDIKNVNSYYWVTDISNVQYAVPNYLTGRRLNLRIRVDY